MTKNVGNVVFQTRDQAKLYNLTYTDTTQRAIIKVDNTTDGSKDPNYGRATVYTISNQNFPLGSLILFDADHLPFGVGIIASFPYVRLTSLCSVLSSLHSLPKVQIGPRMGR